MPDKKKIKEDLLCVPFKEIDWKSLEVIDLFNQIYQRFDQEKVKYDYCKVFS